MTNTLAKSGALYELHRKRGSLRIGADFYARRARQLRRAIRRQRFVLLRLRFQLFSVSVFQRFAP
jgi:hypothetical protein